MSIIITDLKQRIWRAAKQDLAKVEAAKEAAGTNDNSEKYWQRVLRELKRKRPPKPVLSPAHKQRYIDAHRSFQDREYPNAVKDHGYLVTDIPNTAEANGLTKFVVQFLTWSGHFANRTGNEGRVIEKDGKPIRIASSSMNGVQDIDCNLKHPAHPYGIPWKVEIKVGRDRQSNAQKKYEYKVSKTGAKYSLIGDVETFFREYDALFQQKVLF